MIYFVTTLKLCILIAKVSSQLQASCPSTVAFAVPFPIGPLIL